MYSDLVYIQSQNYFLDLQGNVSCRHSILYHLSHHDQPLSFCGLCWLQSRFEGEIPTRIHEYKLLAENGNPATSEKFWRHLEASLGLVPPEDGETLLHYARTRERLYGKRPPRGQFPITSALWTMMGKQPPLAVPLVRAIEGIDEAVIGESLDLSTLDVHFRLTKGIRLAMRIIRNDH